MLTASLVLYKNNSSQINNIIRSFKPSEESFILFIVDNSPAEKFNILKHDIHIEYIANKTNTGFGAAHNIAIKKAIAKGSTYHLVINPDISFDNEVIQSLIRYMEQNPDTGLTMPKILYPNDKIQYLPKLLPSPLQLIKRKFKISKKLFDYWNKYYEMRNIPHDLILEVPIISGCFSLFRTDALIKTGLYDERFFLYFEDFDLSRRIGKFYKTIYYPLVHVKHDYNRGATKNVKLFLIFIQSAIKYFNKWGWFFDKERKLINTQTIQQLKQIK